MLSHTGKTVVLGSGAVAMSLAWAVDAPVVDLTARVIGEPAGVVIVVGADPPPIRVDVHCLDQASWQRLSEVPMVDTMRALQRAHAAMNGRGGRIVVVLPTVGLSGSAGLVPYTTALEGIRAMVKSAARQWGPTGIGVNAVAAPVALFAPNATSFDGHLTSAAAPEDGTMIETVVDAVLFLLRSDVKHLVGATIVADGGAVMLP